MSEVTKQKGVTPDSILTELWTKQEAFAKSIDKLWQTYMNPVVGRFEKARSGFLDLARAADKRALRFGDQKSFVDASDRFINDTYILGALFIQERDKQFQELSKVPEVDGTFRIDKAAAETKAIAEYSLSLADESAIENLKNVHQTWFTDKTGAVYANNSFVKSAKKLIEEGKSGIEVAADLSKAVQQHYGIADAAQKGLNYWAGVAEHTATSAGIAGQLNTLKGLGWSRYVVVNPVDERTTKVCQQMNGKTLVVNHGVANLEATLAAKTPNEVKAASPFVSGGSAKALESAMGSKLGIGDKDLSTEQSLALSKAGFATPPYHFRCRSFIDISFDSGSITPGPEAADFLPPDRPPEGAFPFHLSEMKTSSMKLGGNNPKFVLEGPDGSLWMYKDYTRLNSEFRGHIDMLAARVQKAAGVDVPDTFQFEIPRSWDGWRTNNTGSPHNSKGSLSRLFKSDEVSSFDLKGVGLEDMTAISRVDVQVDHAVNWVISNGDAHYENFITLSNGRVVGIDKAQGMKFFGQDKLAIDYVSQQAPFPSSNGFAYAENQLQRYASGDLKGVKLQGVFNPKGELTDFGKRLQAIVDIPDAEYEKIISPYLKNLPRGGGSGPFARGSIYEHSILSEVFDAVLARKNNLVKDFDKLYKDVEKARSARIAVPAAKKTVVIGEGPALENHSMLRRGLTKQIDDSGLAGFYVAQSGGDFQDLGLMGYRVVREGGKPGQIQFLGKLTKGAGSKLDDFATTNLSGTATVQSTGASTAVNQSVKAEAFWSNGFEKDDVLTFAKSFNAHMDEAAAHAIFDGVVPKKTEALYEALLDKFELIIDFQKKTPKQKQNALAKLGYKPTEIEVDAAKHYHKQLEKFTFSNGDWNPNFVLSEGKKIEKFDSGGFKPATVPKKPKRTKASDKKSFKVRNATENEAVIEHSIITKEGPRLRSEWGVGDLSKHRIMNNRVIAKEYNGGKMKGYVFESTKNSKVSIRFFSTRKDDKFSAFDYQFKVVIDKEKPTKKDYQDSLNLMKNLGLKTKDTTPALDEFKVLWAKKQADSTGLAQSPLTRHLFDIPDDLNAVAKLAKYEEAFDKAVDLTGAEFLSWKNLTKDLTNKDVLPFFDEKALKKGVKKKPLGIPKWLRKDLDENDLKSANIHGLFSSVTGNNAVDEPHFDLIKVMFDNDNAAMLSTTNRARQGIPIGGMSPVDDVATGGAEHVFTRIRSSETNNRGSYGRYGLDSEDLSKKISKKKFNPNKDKTAQFAPEIREIGTDGRESIVVRAGYEEGIYYKRKTMLTTDALSYAHDEYGDIKTADIVSTNMHHAHKATSSKESAANLARRSLANDNEHIIKGSFSITENVENWVVGNHEERTLILEYLKGQGVTKFGKKKIEHVFVVR